MILFSVKVILAINFTILSSCYCSSLHCRINEILIENLTKYYDQNNKIILTVLSIYKPSNAHIGALGPFKKISEDVIQIISNFLDRDSINSLDQSLKYFYLNRKKLIYEALLRINPAFTFNESWMNRIMLNFLITNFSGLKSIEDFNIHDKIWLANIKLIYNGKNESYKIKKDHDSLSENTTHLLLCFMHGIVYGPCAAESITTSIQQWGNIFIQNLMKYDMSECVQKFYNFFTHYDGISVETLREFFASHPDDDTIVNFYYQNFSEPNIASIYYRALKYAIIYRFHLQIVPENEVNETFIRVGIYTQSFSKSFFDRISSDSPIMANFRGKKFISRDVHLMKAFYEKVHVDDNDPMKYLWTRDRFNLFDLEMISSLDGNPVEFVKEMILEILTATNPELVHFDAFRKLIRSGIYNLQDMKPIHDDLFSVDPKNSILSEALKKENSIFFKIIMDESPSPVNFFEYKAIKGLCWTTYTYSIKFSNMSADKFRIFFKSIKGDDPLPIIFLNFIPLKLLKSSISGKKFNVKKRYIVDGDMKNLQIHAGFPFDSIDGKILTLKDLITRLHPFAKNLYKIISKSYSEFEPVELEPQISLISCHKCEDPEIELMPPVSLSKFLHEGVFEPVTQNTYNCAVC